MFLVLFSMLKCSKIAKYQLMSQWATRPNTPKLYTTKVAFEYCSR